MTEPVDIKHKCEEVTVSTGTGRPYYSTTHGGGRCVRWATHTDGKRYFCRQHAKVRATPFGKSEDRVRAECRPI